MSNNKTVELLLMDAARRGIAYRLSCDDRAVAPSAEAVAAVARFVEPLPEQGMSDE